MSAFGGEADVQVILIGQLLILAEKAGLIRIALGDSHPFGAHFVPPKRCRVLSNRDRSPRPNSARKVTRAPMGPFSLFWRWGESSADDALPGSGPISLSAKILSGFDDTRCPPWPPGICKIQNAYVISVTANCGQIIYK
jgi:hypothetical protein